MRSGGRAGSKPGRSRISTAGSRPIADSGRTASAAWRSISPNCKPNRRRRSVAARNNLATSPVREPEERTLVITRVFDAPRALVFKAWTDPATILQWMGPRSHPAVHAEQDLRPGGAWRICLRPKDGGREGLETLISITLVEHQGKTTMTFRQSVFDTTSRRDSHRGGWTSSFDRLEEALAKA